MDLTYYEEEVFEFLYNISVGIERLEKICIILIEHNTIKDQNKFEKSLITHNHSELFRRIGQKYENNLGPVHNAFLQLLSQFYNSWRYDRYTLNEVANYGKEQKALINFIVKYLDVDIKVDFPFNITPNEQRITKFVGQVIGRISSFLYEIICAEASSQNIYTDEVRVDSKAHKIFMRKEYDFRNESIVWKEILIYLVNNDYLESTAMDIIRSIEPLPFERALIGDYIKSFESSLLRQRIIDEVEAIYDGRKDIAERLSLLDIFNRFGQIAEDLDYDDLEGEDKDW